ncbi:HAMP domain-containing sensor histidine kinase [Oleiharenicola lentus]|uniref:HAMP domain-containing sensor histidine kinase n=1 Tax=Oleiharenicola lentus TaxID=2508720 RepID=UPI003F67F8D9
MPPSRDNFSLYRQLALWGLIYLILAACTSVWFINEKLGFGWRALLDGEVGDPVFVYLTGFEPEFQNAHSVADVETVLTKIRTQMNLDAQLVTGREGQRLAGDAFALAPEILLMHSPPGGGQSGGPPGGGRPPEAPNPERVARATQEYFGGPQRRPVAAGQRPPGRLGSKLQGFVSRDPKFYWIILRVPIPSPEDSFVPPRSSLILRTASPWRALGNLALAPLVTPLVTLTLCSLVFWALPIWWITRRLNRATAATARIAAGNFDVRLEPGPADEIGRLALSINELSRRLAEHTNGQRRFIGDVAHEITAPLARLQFAVGILAENAERDPAQRPAAEQVYRELDSTLALVNELLDYARTGKTGATAAPATLALKPFVEKIIAEENATTRTTLTIPETISARADAKLLERALSNLVRNFLRHTPGEALLAITAHAARDRVVLTLADNGLGVAPELLTNLGEPFFRGQATAPDQPGHGLGLAIVRTCVTACGGEVIFRAATPHGFIAEISLPSA